MERYNNTIQDDSGNIITTATVTVYLSSTGAVASIFADNETTALNNPFTVSDSNYDTDGSFWFKADNGMYNVKVVNGGDTSWIYNETLQDNDDDTIQGNEQATPVTKQHIVDELAGDIVTALTLQNKSASTTNSGIRLNLSPWSSTGNIGVGGAIQVDKVGDAPNMDFILGNGTSGSAVEAKVLRLWSSGNASIGGGLSNLYGFGTAVVLTIADQTDSGTNRGVLELVNTRTTPAASDDLGAIVFISENNSGDLRGATIECKLEGSGGGSGLGANIKFRTKADNGGIANSMTISEDGGVTLGSPTGGTKGFGTLNAAGVYDDNTLLTCYVFDQAVDGDIDLVKWDDKAPDKLVEAVDEIKERKDKKGKVITSAFKGKPEHIIEVRHEPVRKFKQRIGSKYDPLDIDKYSQHWKDKKHLTAMPNEETYDPINGAMTTGEWIQRLIETVETQAVHIDNLNQRLKVLESI